MLEPLLVSLSATSASALLKAATAALRRPGKGQVISIKTSDGRTIEIKEGDAEDLLSALAAGANAPRRRPPAAARPRTDADILESARDSPYIRTAHRLADAQHRDLAGGIALADSDKVFDRARERIELVFKIRLGISLIIAAVLVGTVIGAVVSFLYGNTSLGVALGAGTLADLIAAGIYKPLDKITQTLLDTQRLDMIHVMAKQQLSACLDESPESRLECQRQTWSDVMAKLEAIERKPEAAGAKSRPQSDNDKAKESSTEGADPEATMS